jgi:hypothetical protein
MKLAQSQIDPKEIIARVALPYFVPVDFIVRTFLIASISIATFVGYTLLKDKTATSPLQWLFVGTIFCGLGYLQFRPSGISIREEGLEIRKRFFWFNRFGWSDIKKIRTGTQRQLGIRDPSRGLYLTEFTLAGGKAPVLVNIKPYSAKGMSILASFLAVRATNAELDKATLAMIERRFPSLFFAKGQKAL